MFASVALGYVVQLAQKVWNDNDLANRVRERAVATAQFPATPLVVTGTYILLSILCTFPVGQEAPNRN